mgnify:CR=1 FL=1
MFKFFNNKKEEVQEELFLLKVERAGLPTNHYIVDKYTFENFNSWINSYGYFVEIFDIEDRRRYGLRKDSISNYNIQIIKEVKNDK